MPTEGAEGLVKFLEWEARSRDTIEVKRAYIDMAGNLTTGVLLSQIVYWHLPDHEGRSRLRVAKDGNLWLAKRREEWWAECRVSPRQADRCLSKLEELGIIRTAVYKFSGNPTTHIRIDQDGFLRAWEAAGNPLSRNGDNGITETVITELPDREEPPRASESRPKLQRIQTETTDIIDGTLYCGEDKTLPSVPPPSVKSQPSIQDSGSNVNDSVPTNSNGAQAGAVCGTMVQAAPAVSSDVTLVLTLTEAINSRAWQNRDRARATFGKLLAEGYTPERIVLAYRQYAQDPTLLKTPDAFAKVAFAVTEGATTLFDGDGTGYKKKPEPGVREVWHSYSDAYHTVYQERPVNNARVNSQIAQLIKRVGIDDAINMAAWFVTHRAQRYTQAGHTVGILLQDAEKLRTEWKRGVMLHNRDAKEIDRLSADNQMWDRVKVELADKLEAWENGQTPVD